VMGYYYDADLTLGSGKTLTGDYSASVTNALANEFFMGSFSFPLRLASAPSGPNVNFIPSGSASTTNCPGTHANPTALPGNLCVYESAFNNRTFEGLFGTGVAVYASIDRFGGAIGLHATAAGRAHSYGTWAVTAP
jgi:hypothetical protein